MTYRSSVRRIFKHRRVVISISNVDMDHRSIGSSTRVCCGDCQDISSLLLEVQWLSYCDQATAILRSYGETAACVTAGYFVVKSGIEVVSVYSLVAM